MTDGKVANKETRLKVRVRPGAGRTRIKEKRAGVLRMDVAAAPEKGKANAELVRFFAKLLGIPRSGVRIRSGERSRDKVVGLSGIDGKEIEEMIREAVGGEK
jgi:uncharacterized protein (TIGR00251 family)